MAICAWCGTLFTASGRRRFHADACRQASYRARHAVLAKDSVPVVVRPEATVYECPGCEARYLGLFSSRLRLGQVQSLHS